MRPRMRSYDGIFRSAFRYPPYQLDKVLQKQGWQVAEDELNLSACRAPFNLKRYAALADGWEVVPAVTDPYDSRAEEAKAYADFTTYCFNNIVSPAGLPQDFRAVLFELQRALWEGFRVSEIGYRDLDDGPYAGRWGYDGFYAKHAKQIGFDIDPMTSQVLTITSYTPGGSALSLPGGAGMASSIPGGYDFQVPVERCVLWTHNPEANLPFGDGDWRPCYPHFAMLSPLMKFWGVALERFGSPFIITQAPSEADFNAIITTLQEIRNGGDGVLPDTIKYIVEQASQGVFDGFQKACDWHTKEIRMAVLHSTLTTSEGEHGATSAGSDVHKEITEIVVEAARRELEGVVNSQIIRRLMRANFAGFDESLLPCLSLGKDAPEDILKLAQAFDLLVQDGIVWKRAKFVRERLGMPPLDPEEQKGLQEEEEAGQEAQERLADLKATNQAPAKMSQYDDERAIARLTRAVLAQREREKQVA